MIIFLHYFRETKMSNGIKVNNIFSLINFNSQIYNKQYAFSILFERNKIIIVDQFGALIGNEVFLF